MSLRSEVNEKLKMRDILQWFFEREWELAENERVNELNVSCCNAKLK